MSDYGSKVLGKVHALPFLYVRLCVCTLYAL